MIDLIDDVNLFSAELGRPILFSNQEIRKMLNLAKANAKDVFYDLGSGWGQNVLIALTEFRVAKAVGIEDDPARCSFAKERLRWQPQKIRENGAFLCTKFEELLKKRNKFQRDGFDLEEATIVFFGLSSSTSFFRRLERKLAEGCKLVYYYRWLIPEIMPIYHDFPFFVSTAPFETPKREREWLSEVMYTKTRSSLPKRKGKAPSAKEFWSEISHDYDVDEDNDRRNVLDYKRRLKQVL